MAKAMEMAEKSGVWRSKGLEEKTRKINKNLGCKVRKICKIRKGRTRGKKGLGMQSRARETANAETSSGSIATVASTSGQIGGERKIGRRPCMACGGKHVFRKYPQWANL